MPAIYLDYTKPHAQQQPTPHLADLGWFEQMQMQFQLPKQESMFRHWENPSLPIAGVNMVPRGVLNETIASGSSSNEDDDVMPPSIRVRDFDANKDEKLAIDGMKVLPITISVFVFAVLLIAFVSLIKCYRRRQKAKSEAMEVEDETVGSSSKTSLSSGSSFDDIKAMENKHTKDMKDIQPIHPAVLDKYTTAPTKITNLRQLQAMQKESQRQAPTMRQWTPGSSPIAPPVKPWTNHLPIKDKRSPKQSSPYPIVKDNELPAIPQDAFTSPNFASHYAYYSSPRAGVGRKGRTSTRR
ncbi:hypothetical protein E3P92_01467 [Wallemia ichthyophaga]|nr:hypothetical protein E3P91_01138 [Wallemia ichthyophaga]TIB16111.1 hypothetical protein E3P92_01467 [Wallemia ichthyophaga]TIB64289.1 hypothetical protein E3P78_01285 [Wallemia ichthyophaga]